MDRNAEDRKDLEKQNLPLEHYKFIMEQIEDIIFEWDIYTDTLRCTPNWEKKFGYRPIETNISKRILLHSHIHPEDMPLVLNLLNDARKGEAFFSEELRIRNAEGEYLWCRVRVSDQFDRFGLPLRAVGVITDIDQEKKILEGFKKRAQRDVLTGLYNREETENKIKKYMKSNLKDHCALFMIDTDNFKQVNDSQGHLYGDAVLSKMASCMKNLMRKSDIVGRIGGDEFMVFLKNVSGREMVEAKADQLLESFRALFKDGKQPAEITCSVGVAMYPDDGTDFRTLYNCADQALYQAKIRGKNQYSLFDRRISVPVERTGYTSLGAMIDSDQRIPNFSSELVNYALRILYESKDIDQAIHLLLEIVGKRFDVSRAYVFESTDNGEFCDNTYEWCNEGIGPEKENLQHISYAEMDDYTSLFKPSPIFYCRDIKELAPKQVELFESQGICSTLQCAIRDRDEFHGFVGFDECTGLRLWTGEEVEVLTLIAQLLTTFLQKQRAMDRDRELASQLASILDLQDAYIYAVRKDSYEILYINRKTRELDSGAQIGMHCFEQFFGKKEPCAACPLHNREVKEVYNPQYQVWTRVHPVEMKWGGSDAYLLSCYDITEYRM